MSIPRCDLCKFWGRDDSGTPLGVVYGDSTCDHPRDLMYRSFGDKGLIWTRPEFRCGQFEARINERREEMRRYAREEAEQAGLNENEIDAVVDMAVGNAMSDPETGEIDMDYFEELVVGIIQGVANP